VHRRLAKLRTLHLEFEDAWGVTHFGNKAIPPISVKVVNPRFYVRLVFFGHLGAADSFVSADVECDRLIDLLRGLLRDTEVCERLDASRPMLVRWGLRLCHRLRSNTRSGSRRNIHEHYDLGNEFFRIFLDTTLSYSCAWFETAEISLEKASLAKIDKLLEKLELRPTDHLLEIGCGWGALAVRAAETTGCRVTAVTISREQFALANARAKASSAADRIEILLKDYRDVTGRYDKAVSVEMIEAVGHRFYETYFGQLSRLLKPDGILAIQVITHPDQDNVRRRKEVDFIQARIFPGSDLATLGSIQRAIQRATDLSLSDMEDFTHHYARTLRCWHDTFVSKLAEVKALGFPEEFFRTWIYYFVYCEAGFAERHIGCSQLVFRKPGWRPSQQQGVQA